MPNGAATATKTARAKRRLKSDAEPHPAFEEPKEVNGRGNGANQPRRKMHFKDLKPRNDAQIAYLKALRDARNDVVVGFGPAGAGRTFLSTAVGYEALELQKVWKFVGIRPAVTADEELGYLPGTFEEKIDPYFYPIYDTLEMFGCSPKERMRRVLAGHMIFAPVAFMRGRNFFDSVMVVDEAQNLTISQMRMVLTRLCPGTRIFINGDPKQCDLPKGVDSGLTWLISHKDQLLSNKSDAVWAFCEFHQQDVVRHAVSRDIANLPD